MYDKDIRKLLINKIKYNNSRIIEEYDIGSRRADVVEIYKNKTICYEIKSDKDSLIRLSGQIKEYSKFFDEVYVVVGTKYSNISEFIPDYCGIIIASDKLEIIRNSSTNKKFRLKNFLTLLWKDELNSIIDSKNFPKKLKRINKINQRKYIMENVDNDDLKRTCLKFLFERKNWR